MAPREGFEPPRPMDSGFRIHRNTGLCELGECLLESREDDKRDGERKFMQVTLIVDGERIPIEIREGSTINDVLIKANISPSTVLATHEDNILPHHTTISSNVELELIVVSSGG